MSIDLARDEGFDLDGARWSSAVICARRSIYEYVKAPAYGVSEETRRLFTRGQLLGGFVAELYASQNGVEIQTEVEIPWPAHDPVGVGHADIYVPAKRHIVEVKSSTDMKLKPWWSMQAAGYAINHPEAATAEVIVVHPSTFEVRNYDIDVEALRPEVAALQARVATSIRDGEVPERTCSGPNDQRAYMCPFREHCFADWEVPEVAHQELPDGDHEALLRYLEIRDTQNALKAEADAIRATIIETYGQGARLHGPGVKATIASMGGSDAFSLSDMRAAGRKLPSELREFVTKRKRSPTLRVTRVKD